MKVCHLTSVHIPFDTRIFYKECRSLAEAGYEVHLIAPHDSDAVVDGVHLHAIRKREGKLKRILFSTTDVLKKALAVNAPLYHFHDPELIPVGLVLHILGRTVIYDVHEDYPETIPNKRIIPRSLRKPAGWIMSVTERFASGLFDAVIVVTPAIYERFRTYTGKTHIIHNFPLTRDRVSTPWNKREDAVCYIGSISSNRGIREMLKAIGLVQKHIPVKLVLAGEFTSSSLEQEIKALPEFSLVDFRGFVDRDEAEKLMAQVKAGIIVLHPEPRYQVSYPNKLFEYMIAGIPVIASAFPLWSEIIQEAGCGVLVDPMNPMAIAGALLSVLGNPPEAQAMGARGHEAVEKKFRWENEKQKLLKLYESLGREHSGEEGDYI